MENKNLPTELPLKECVETYSVRFSLIFSFWVSTLMIFQSIALISISFLWLFGLVEETNVIFFLVSTTFYYWFGRVTKSDLIKQI